MYVCVLNLGVKTINKVTLGGKFMYPKFLNIHLCRTLTKKCGKIQT